MQVNTDISSQKIKQISKGSTTSEKALRFSIIIFRTNEQISLILHANKEYAHN